MQTQAERNYEFKRMKINNQIRTLQDRLNRMDKRQDSDPMNWGYSGNAGHITEELAKILEFIGDDTEETLF